MSATNNGGPAYPDGNGNQAGMSMRDHFSGLAMQAWVASSPVIEGEQLNGTAAHAKVIAVIAYVRADAMLKARTTSS